MTEEALPRSTRAIYAGFDFVGFRWRLLAVLTLLFGLAALAASGLYIVKKEEQAVLTRFGKVVDAEVGPGVRYRIPVIEAAHIRPVKRIARLGVASKSGDTVNFTILSGDTNLLEIEVVVQYLIGNLRDYLFAAADPVKLMEMVVREGLVDAVGSNFIDLIFTSNRNIIEEHLFEDVADRVAAYGIGVEVAALTIVDVRPIDETVAAFRDVNDAIAERTQAESEANRRAERFLARTRGQGESLVLNAQARANERIGQARSAADAFLALLAEFRSEPNQVAVTRYWQRMRTIFSQASLAAVNPGDASTIDINMIDGVGAPPIGLGVVGAPPAAGDDGSGRALRASTAPRDLHVGTDGEMDLLTMDGRFHDRRTERDHMGPASPRSLIFDSPSIFAHGHVQRTGPVVERQPEQQPLVETIPEETPEADATKKHE
ncbi:MAG: SPFH domain-containing protein [Gammaproteobacteria bacterium]|nr:SPFH domain-containing protein [Gammaproteobacteria bacterium]